MLSGIPIGPGDIAPLGRTSSTKLFACSLVWSRHPGIMTKHLVTDLLALALRILGETPNDSATGRNIPPGKWPGGSGMWILLSPPAL